MKIPTTLSLLLGITVFLLLSCVDPISVPDPTDTGNGTDTTTTGPVATTAPVIRGRVSSAAGLAKSRGSAGNEADQLWIIPIYERRGGNEDGLSFMSLSSTRILSLDSNGYFSYAYADQNAPDGIPVIDRFPPAYSHSATDQSVFTGTVLMVLANSQKASSLNLTDRKEAILGFVSLDAQQSGTTLVGIPLGTVTAEADIDLGEITPDSDNDEALAETPLADVEEYFQLSLSQLLAMAQADDMLKAIANQFVNSKIVPYEPDSTVTKFWEHGKDNVTTYEYWAAGLGFLWLGDTVFKSIVSNAPAEARWVEDWSMGGGGYMEPANIPTEANPTVYRLERTVWEPNTGFSIMHYRGYEVNLSTNTPIAGATVTVPPLVDMTGIVVVPEPDNNRIRFEHEDQRGSNYYFLPASGQPRVAPGWWDVSVGGAMQASFQLDLADPFDAQNNMRVMVPRVDLDVSETMLASTVWYWDEAAAMGGTGTIEPGNGTTIDTAKIWIDLEEVTGLRVTWYVYNPASGSYEPTELSPGNVTIEITLESPLRFESYTRTAGFPEPQGQPISPQVQDLWFDIPGEHAGDISLDLTGPVRVFFPPGDARDSQWFDRHDSHRRYRGEYADGVYWHSLTEWAPVRTMHISYSHNGVNSLFSFNLPR